MGASRTARSGARRRAATRKGAAGKPAAKAAAIVPQQVLMRLCKPGWAVVVEKTAAEQGTRFVCPFCPNSHRVPGPVRGFRKVRRAQWIKLRRVGE